ncbi:hypothetical protein SPAN111604_08340 [Sphingomonas antarctica]|uniref:TonB family protein n=1 Tax=Sphingomonas antarctica TaxID=2040274 RepID=UPI0039EC24D3
MDTHIAPKPALIAGVLEAALLYALIAGLGFSVPGAQTIGETLKTFDMTPPPTPPLPPPPQQKSGRTEGAAAPAGLRAKASAIVAPPPPIPLPPPPIVAAPVAGVGTQSRQGASDVDGGGTGAGGVGDGFGSGGRGFGDGGGGRECGGNWRSAAPCQTGGDISYNDVGKGIEDPGDGLDMEIEFEIGTDGRVRECEVTKSSGYLGADDNTCRVVEQRFRYRPALRNGQPVTSLMSKHMFLEAIVEPVRR